MLANELSDVKDGLLDIAQAINSLPDNDSNLLNIQLEINTLNKNLEGLVECSYVIADSLKEIATQMKPKAYEPKPHIGI